MKLSNILILLILFTWSDKIYNAQIDTIKKYSKEYFNLKIAKTSKYFYAGQAIMSGIVLSEFLYDFLKYLINKKKLEDQIKDHNQHIQYEHNGVSELKLKSNLPNEVLDDCVRSYLETPDSYDKQFKFEYENKKRLNEAIGRHLYQNRLTIRNNIKYLISGILYFSAFNDIANNIIKKDEKKYTPIFWTSIKLYLARTCSNF